MSDISDQPPRLDEQLEEIDRRLRLIRSELESRPRVGASERADQVSGTPRAGPLSEALQRARRHVQAAAAAPAPRPGRPNRELAIRLEALRALQAALAELEARVVEALGTCREALGRALELAGEAPDSVSSADPAGPPGSAASTGFSEPAGSAVSSGSAVPTVPAPSQVTVNAGPFRDLAAVHAFERLLAELDPVAEVRIAGYEGADGVVLEVRLRDPGESTS